MLLFKFEICYLHWLLMFIIDEREKKESILKIIKKINIKEINKVLFNFK